jgi:uncharacterized protein (DUF58 family)
MASWWAVLRQRLGSLWSPNPDAEIRLRLRLPVLWIAGLVAAALLLPDRVWTTLLIGLGGLVLVAYAWARSLSLGLDGDRRLRYGWVSVGDRLEEAFSLVNRSLFPALWVEIVDDSNVPGYEASVVHTVGGRETVRWRQSAICTRRGLYHLGPWTLRSGDPFGLFVATRRLPALQEIIIHPPVNSRLPIPLPPGQSEGRSRTTERAWQATVNAAGVRDYHQNDPYRWIHWPTTARRDQLFVRQFDRDAAGDVWLVIDCDAAVQLGEGIAGTEEQAVLIAASLAARAASEYRPVGLAAYGSAPQVVLPALGQGQQWSILRALALLRADGQVALGRSLRELADTAHRGSAVLVITPSVSPDWLPALLTLARGGLESHVLLLDRPSYGGEGNTAGLADAVTSMGFHCHIIRKDDVGRPLLQEERHGFWEFKVTGTGKAVAIRRPTDA